MASATTLSNYATVTGDTILGLNMNWWCDPANASLGANSSSFTCHRFLPTFTASATSDFRFSGAGCETAGACDFLAFAGDVNTDPLDAASFANDTEWASAMRNFTFASAAIAAIAFNLF